MALALTAGCTARDGSSAGARREPTTTTDAGSTPRPSPSPTIYVRPCADSVYGDLGRHFRDDSIRIGPVLLVGARHLAGDPARYFETRAGHPKGMKVLLLVREGGPPVTVNIARRDRATAGLLYDPNLFNTHRLDRADRAIVFEPCKRGSTPEGFTQFNGAFIVDGPRCVDVVVQPRDGRAIRETVSFGAGDCGRSA